MNNSGMHNRRGGDGSYRSAGGQNTEKFSGSFFMGRGSMPAHRTKKVSTGGSNTKPMGEARIRPTRPGAK